jgi:CheY-like chemotaxis protein
MSERDNSCRVIMVVDDYEATREILGVFLTAMGYDVIEACNGLEAVKIARSACPDLIIMDLAMPVMDGYGALRLLRELPEVSTVPVVACTAHDDSTQRAHATRVGFDELLAKPIDFIELHNLVDRFLKAA